MRRCPQCAVTIEGAWSVCPLCGSRVTSGPETITPDPFPAVPLRFSRKRVLRILLLSSLGVVVASLAAQLLFGHETGSVGLWRSIWLGLVAMWLLVITAVNQRRNVARTTLFLVVLVGLVCVYWDYLTGWHSWSLTYAVPSVCVGSSLALAITVRARRIAHHDHVVFSGLTMLLGVVPLVFLPLNWVGTPWPAAVCGTVSLLMLINLQTARGREVRQELARYLHL